MFEKLLTTPVLCQGAVDCQHHNRRNSFTTVMESRLWVFKSD